MRTTDAISDLATDARIDLSLLDAAALQSMAEAGRDIVEVHRVLAKSGDNVVGEILRGQGTFYEWDHFPPGDVYDRETHSQYYYHAHTIGERFDSEHGHFHSFIRPKGMPPWIKPAAVPDYSPPADPNDALSHLVAISMTPQGIPFRLFTVNRWVTGEVWYDAEDVITLLDYFEIDHARPSWPTNRWMTAMVRLYRPVIVDLLRQRDRTIAAWRQAHPEIDDIFEDRRLEVTSYADISIEEQVRAVGRALLDRDPESGAPAREA